ncbi:flavonol reductase/cinnamoyl-CoA reductase family protein [Schizosaccharomyces japonicus yFS275]|uniref:Flavonol reductase/cinnamoyl-CoA reductase family protein n=1 Tax=Schizosaccharomyces japonicus (strain yFS275 / FY16936) TaxID=402676 RepID=B6K2Y5_SCHJY|nr:flavonol reductase/cinnamoyl-CoA reductase family protein [Schizosaccharomyces japonicus yFS275]EEB07842.1 flavonol reductase/cinnamoyl-CoA reductase family protein [Schizosaccharomyces japonicus yFS275]
MEPLVLVTGITGFVASHTVDALLDRGYRVRGTYRKKDKLNQLFERQPSWKTRVELAYVADGATPGSYDVAMKGVDYVCHIASPVHRGGGPPRPRPQTLLEKAVYGTLNVMFAAVQNKSVKRVIFISSDAAVKGDKNYCGEGHVFTEKDWSPLTLQDAHNSTDEVLNYAVSKKFAEKAVHELVEIAKPSFDIVCLCPPLILGPVIHLTDLKSLNFSGWYMWNLINGENNIAPKTTIYNYVDVRDVAQAEVKALTANVSHDRFIISAGSLSNDEITEILLRKTPEKKNLISKPSGDVVSRTFDLDASLSKKELGITYRPKEETFVDAAESLWEIANLW